MFTVVLTPESLAAAHFTAEQRPKNIKHHRPSEDPNADLYGAMSEHAFAQHLRIPQSSVDSSGGPRGRGDGGIDFELHEGTVDVKSSARHDSSWIVPGGDLTAEWYVFAHVVLPDTVHFKGKARRETLAPIAATHAEGRKRLVCLAEVEDIGPEDFTRQPVGKGTHRGRPR